MVSAFRVEEEDISSNENDSKDSDEEEADERSVCEWCFFIIESLFTVIDLILNLKRN